MILIWSKLHNDTLHLHFCFYFFSSHFFVLCTHSDLSKYYVDVMVNILYGCDVDVLYIETKNSNIMKLTSEVLDVLVYTVYLSIPVGR